MRVLLRNCRVGGQCAPDRLLDGRWLLSREVLQPDRKAVELDRRVRRCDVRVFRRQMSGPVGIGRLGGKAAEAFDPDPQAVVALLCRPLAPQGWWMRPPGRLERLRSARRDVVAKRFSQCIRIPDAVALSATLMPPCEPVVQVPSGRWQRFPGERRLRVSKELLPPGKPPLLPLALTAFPNQLLPALFPLPFLLLRIGLGWHAPATKHVVQVRLVPDGHQQLIELDLLPAIPPPQRQQP